MAGQFGLTGTSTLWELTAWEYWPVFIICSIASTPVCPFFKERFLAWVEGRKPAVIREKGIVNPRHLDTCNLAIFYATPSSSSRKTAFVLASIIYDLALIALLLASCVSVVSGSFNPFIYFQF